MKSLLANAIITPDAVPIFSNVNSRIVGGGYSYCPFILRYYFLKDISFKYF